MAEGAEREDDIQKALFVGNYEGAVDTCFKAGRLADALLVANIGGAELFKKTMHRYMRRNPRPYMAVRGRQSKAAAGMCIMLSSASLTCSKTACSKLLHACIVGGLFLGSAHICTHFKHTHPHTLGCMLPSPCPSSPPGRC